MTGGEAGIFGALLRRYRRAAALSQEALAERAGLSAVAISTLERGTRRSPYLATVELLADALGLVASDRAALLAAARPQASSRDAAVAAGTLVPLVGRARELALLDAFLAGEGGPLGTARVLLLAGEPGIGKTRLLQAAAQRAIAQGWRVLAGGCQRRGGQEPYAPLLDALAQHLQAMTPAQRRGALAGCAWLVRLLPELAEELPPLPAGTVPPEHERRLVFAAVRRLLANAAGPAGTLLMLDDLQWAGTDALDLIDALMRTTEAPLRLVGAYRDTQVRPADPLGLLLADLAQARLARQHSLGPLAEEEAAALLEDLLVDVPAGDRGTVEAVLRRAGGTPFYLVSYAQALQQGGADGIPWDVAQGVRQRVALLPAAGQEILGIAAAAGRRAPRALLVAAAARPEEEVLAGLEAACRARLLLDELDDGYAFAHDLIREVVEADLGTARRAVLHRRVAEALEGAPAVAPDLLAYHYARADSPEKAAVYLERAGDHAWGQRAHAAAEHHYREALASLERLGPTQDMLRVREALAEVLYQTGRYAAAITVLEPAAAAFRTAGDLQGLGRVAARIGWAHTRRGLPREGLALIEPLVGLVEQDGPSLSVAALHAALGQLRYATGQYSAALAASERATALARDGGDDRLHALAAAYRMFLLHKVGRLTDAVRAGQEVLPLVEAVGDLDILVRAHRDLADLHIMRGAVATSLRHVARARAVAEQMEDPAQLAHTLAQATWVLSLSGDWPAARAALDEAMALGQPGDRSWYAPYPAIDCARFALASGAGEEAATAVTEALALAQDNGDLQALRWASAVRAELDVLEGHPEAARARLVPLLDRPGLEEGDVTALLPVLAWADLEQGRVEEAAVTVGQVIARARREEMRLVLVEALRVQALVALRRQQWDETTRSLEEGLALARAIPYPYAEARLLHAYGQLHLDRGEAALAREWLEAALALAHRLGARRDTAQLEQALASLLHHPAPLQNPPSPECSGQARETWLTEAQWTMIAALLPQRARTRRPRADDRQTIEAILYKLETGCAWSALPAALGDGVTAHRRLRAWEETGVWTQIAAIVRAEPRGQPSP